jgi:molybdopterin-guanine dinucleotide biosynthesis protein A
MGRDKASLALPDGRTLLERAVSILREAGAAEVIVSTGDARSYGLPDTREVCDEQADQGPLAGLVAGFAAAAHEHVAVLAVDLPHMTAEFMKGLLSEATTRCGVVPTRGELAEPLAAVYPLSACILARAALNNGRLSLQPWVRELHRAEVVRLRPLGEQELAVFANWNSPEECR